MVAIGTKVPGRIHPTLVKEAKGCSVVAAVVTVVFIWSRLFKTLVSNCRQNLKKCGEVAFFRGELLLHAPPGRNDERGEREGESYQEWKEGGEA